MDASFHPELEHKDDHSDREFRDDLSRQSLSDIDLKHQFANPVSPILTPSSFSNAPQARPARPAPHGHGYSPHATHSHHQPRTLYSHHPHASHPHHHAPSRHHCSSQQVLPIKKAPSEPRKIKKFIRCSKLLHLNLRTTTSLDESKLGIVINKGAISADHDLYIRQHLEYQVNYTQKEPEHMLLATIPKHADYLHFNFQNVISFTQYIINNGFIRFRNHGPTQTKHVSLWRIYQFEGEVSVFNIWCVIQAFEQTLHIESAYKQRLCSNASYYHIKKKNKTGKEAKNYHLAAIQSTERRTDTLSEHILKNIFSFLSHSKYHCWIHIHEIIDKSYHRSNLIGLEFDGTSRNVYVMPRSPALMKKLRQIGDRYFTKTIVSDAAPFTNPDHDAPKAVLKDAFFKKSVEMFKAVY